MSGDPVTIDVGDVRYVLEPQPIRTSLSDDVHMLWGLQVHVLRGEELVGIKTCFVGRVSVQGADPEALKGTFDDLVPVIHRLAIAKIRGRLEAGEPGDEIIFA